MRFLKRFSALSLSVCIGVGAVCYKPTPVKAVISESVLFSAVASTFMSMYAINFDGTSFSFGPSAMAETLTDVFEDMLVPQFIAAKEAAADAGIEPWEHTAEGYITAVLSGCQISEFGKVFISDQAGRLLAYFVSWFIEAFDLETSPDPVLLETFNSIELSNGFRIFATMPYYGTENGIVVLNLNDAPFEFKSGNSLQADYMDGTYRFAMLNSSGTWVGGHTNKSVAYLGVPISKSSSDYVLYDNLMNQIGWYTANIYSHSLVGAQSINMGGLSVTQEEEPEVVPPVLGANQSYSLDLGLSAGATESDFVNAVGEGILAGENIVQSVTAETVGSGEATEDEEQTVIGWLQEIFSGIGQVGQQTADRVAGKFKPSEAYMDALPARITETFDGRTGFLTYPFTVLTDFAGRLSADSSDFIIRWPDVKEPFSGVYIIEDGQFNVTQFVKSNSTFNSIYSLWMIVCKGYLVFAFLQLCRRKYDSVVGDRLGG